MVIFLIHLINGLTFGRIIEYVEVDFQSTRIPAELDGYRIAFITDTHRISADRLSAVVERLNNSDIDVLLLGGDFQTGVGSTRRSLGVLAQTITTDGIYGVEGNHDNFRHLFAVMAEYNITPLSNSGLHIHDNFFLAGVEDLMNRNPDIALAIADASDDDFVLLLAHNPDLTMRQYTGGIDLILSGHTHGGQVTFFGLWAPALTLTRHITSYGQRFMSGWAESRDGVPVFVSNGTGEYFIRVFARPQVVIVTLVSEGN